MSRFSKHDFLSIIPCASRLVNVDLVEQLEIDFLHNIREN